MGVRVMHLDAEHGRGYGDIIMMILLVCNDEHSV